MTTEQIKQLEADISEELSKILIKLKDLETVKFVSTDEGRYYVPDNYDVDDKVHLDENGKLKPDARFSSDYNDPVKFQSQYDSFKLSTLKMLLSEIMRRDTLQSSDSILAKYYNSNCY